MASKKKNPSFEIPDAVRRAGQSGWVYRSEPMKGKPHRGAPARHARTKKVVPGATLHPPAATPRKQRRSEPPVAAATPEQAAGAWSVSTGVIGLGLHVAAVPLVVPLYVTAAISRKLGLLP